MKITKKLSDLVCKLTNVRFLPVIRKRGTFKISYVNFKTNEARALYIQFTLKDPWWLPHYEEHFGSADIPLAGWLFFYVGLLTEGIVYPGDEKAKIIDKDGNRYYYVDMSREEADDYHKKTKAGKRFYILADNLNSRVLVREVTLDGKI